MTASSTASSTVTIPAPTDTHRAPNVKHIRLPDDPDTAYCGAKKSPDGRRHYWRASFPGALKYARGE